MLWLYRLKMKPDTNENIDRIIYLLTAKATGKLTAGELDELAIWVNASDKNKEIAEEFSTPGFAANLLTTWNRQDADDSLLRIKQKIVRKNSMKLWPRISAIAAVVCLMISGIYFFSYNKDVKDSDKGLAANERPPGSFSATLILANGAKIKLNDVRNGEIATESGISITKTADGQLVYQVHETKDGSNKVNTLSTAKGETYVLTLPDKSKVWLNAESNLTFSTTLNRHGIRKVKLEGEAYFEIFKDKAHPFVVETNQQEVEVLGTHFNLSAYKQEHTKTTLLEGSVKVSPRVESLTGMVIKPGQMAELNGADLKISNVDVNDAVAWKNGLFVFDNERLEVAMLKLERWYNVEVVYQNEALKKLEVGGSITRYGSITKILKMFEKSGKLKFVINDKKVTVTEH